MNARQWRLLGWGMAAGLLLLPLVAMQFTSEVRWTGFDFLVAALMLGAAGGAFELALRLSGLTVYRAGAALAILTAFLLVWINGAVGIIGDEKEPANALYLGVVLLAVLGALLVRFRAAGLARVMGAAAIAHLLIAAGLLFAGDGPAFVLTLFFGGLWALSAGLFREAARG